MATDLWVETEIRELGIDVPRWIDQDITAATVAAIIQGGCSSGAYMPAVTYHQALATMQEYGDDVLQYIEDSYGSLSATGITLEGKSWAGIACDLLSAAVELWASSVEQEVGDALEDREEEMETYTPTTFWTVPPELQGQIVEHAYSTDAEAQVILQRTRDGSDGSVEYRAFSWPEDSDGTFAPWNGAPKLGDDLGRCNVEDES